MTSAQKAYLAAAFFSLNICLALPAGAQTSDYRIGPGETVEINISSAAEPTVRKVVQADGTIVLNYAGSIMVAGLTPSEFQTQLEIVLPTKLFREATKDGVTRTFIVAPGEITSSVVAFRPVYVSGDVLTPGEQPYHPSLTARQVIAVSGGYSQIRGKIAKEADNPVDLQREYQSLWTDFLKAHFHKVRLDAEFKGHADFDQRAPAGSPLPLSLSATISKGEQQALKITLEEGVNQELFLAAALKAADEQIETLTRRETVEAAGEKADEQELAKVTQLFKNGNLTNDRVADIRRSLLLTSSRRLGTIVELMKVNSQRADLQRQVQKDTNQKKIGVLDDLRDTAVLVANLEVKLRAAAAKLQLQNVVIKSEPAPTDLVQPQITIVRKIGATWQTLPANGNTEILPGDVLEVSLCREGELGSAVCPDIQAAAQIDPQMTDATSGN